MQEQIANEYKEYSAAKAVARRDSRQTLESGGGALPLKGFNSKTAEEKHRA